MKFLNNLNELVGKKVIATVDMYNDTNFIITEDDSILGILSVNDYDGATAIEAISDDKMLEYIHYSQLRDVLVSKKIVTESQLNDMMSELERKAEEKERAKRYNQYLGLKAEFENK